MVKRVFETLDEYGAEDLGGRHRSTAGEQEKVDPALLASLLSKLEIEGYVIIEDVFDKQLLDGIREDVMPRFVHSKGRNNFEGSATQRLYAVIEKTFACNPIVESPLALGLLDSLFSVNYLLSQLQVINILPGEAQQPLHYDDAFYHSPRPRPPLGAATIIAVDDFSEDNGATVLIPRSHLWDGHAPDAAEKDRLVPAVMPAGSMLFFLGTTWHGGGANHTAAGRLCVTAQYCQPWCRTQENYSLSVSKSRARQCSESIKRLLGYSIHPPFMGMVDGMHPKRALDVDDES